MSLKVVVVALMGLLCIKTARSQSDELLVQGQTGNLHLQHTVVAKENWYSIGRLYNLSPKDLASHNKLDMTKPLSIGQELEIPLTAGNFSQNGVKAAGETLVPLYHIVQEKEWLYRISVNNNKVSVASLEKWNNINKDQVKAGMHVIVGYLKVKTALSALATKNSGMAVAAKPDTTAHTIVKSDYSEKTDKPLEAVKSEGTNIAKTEESSAVKPVETGSVKTEGTTAVKPAVAGTAMADGGASSSGGSGVKPVSASGKSFNGGFFKNDYSDGTKSASGVAGIFKSTSGWQDGKYYALMNNIPVGTIVKVTDGASGKTIYAKVLGQLPDMKESAGLTIRISNAAASELGQGDSKFNVDVRY
jgi:LysM repeat protein